MLLTSQHKKYDKLGEPEQAGQDITRLEQSGASVAVAGLTTAYAQWLLARFPGAQGYWTCPNGP
jgi:hypothetical protein